MEKKQSTHHSSDTGEIVFRQVEEHVRRLERKCELQRKELLEYKKKLTRYNVNLTNKNRKIREERVTVGEKFFADRAMVERLKARNKFLEHKVAVLETNATISTGIISTMQMKTKYLGCMEKITKEQREELFYWEQHHSEHLQATLSAVLEQQDRVLKQFLLTCTNHLSLRISCTRSEAIENPTPSQKEELILKKLLDKQKRYSEEKLIDMERKYLSVKQINLALERRLMQLTQQLECLNSIAK
jgi:hypothetical protein